MMQDSSSHQVAVLLQTYGYLVSPMLKQIPLPNAGSLIVIQSYGILSLRIFVLVTFILPVAYKLR